MLLILFVYFFIYKISLDTTVFPDKFRPDQTWKFLTIKKQRKRKEKNLLKLESRLEFRGFVMYAVKFYVLHITNHGFRVFQRWRNSMPNMSKNFQKSNFTQRTFTMS